MTNESKQLENDSHKPITNERLGEIARIYPIKIHYILKSKSDSIPIKRIIRRLDSLNKHFAPINFAFQLCGNIDTVITNTTYASFWDRLQEDSLFKNIDVSNAINIYFADTLKSKNLCGYTYLGYKKNRIFVSSHCATSTLTHEMGHYFNLYHTFEPLFGRELVNESNCLKAGDLICDTPADPFLPTSYYALDSSCTYRNVILDSLGMEYHPLTNNLMSYYISRKRNCRNSFTNGQYSRMLSNLYLNKWTYFCGVPPGLLSSSSVNISLFPNPLIERCILKITKDSNLETKAQIKIINVNGQNVYEDSISIPGQKELNLTSLASGIYQIIIDTKQEVIRKKIVVQ